MLLRIFGLLIGVVLLSLALSWYLSIPVLGMFLKLLVLVKSLKWPAIWLAVRNVVVSTLTTTMPGRIFMRVLTRFIEGLGLDHLFAFIAKVIGRTVDLTLGRFLRWMTRRSFAVRFAAAILFVIGIVWLSFWKSLFLVFFLWLPFEITLALKALGRYIGTMLAKTRLADGLIRLLTWFMGTRLGRWLKRLDDAFEAVVSERAKTQGRAQRLRLSQSAFGRRVIRFIDRFAPTMKPPRHKPSRNPFATGTIHCVRPSDTSAKLKPLPRR